MFWQGLSTGMTIKAAARAAGVSRNSGALWLAQAGGMKPTATALESRISAGTGRLTFADRCCIEELVGKGSQPARIARLLGRSRSTISRELVRGRPAGDGEYRYRAIVAQTTVDQGRRRPKPRKLQPDTALYAEVVDMLGKRLSPEQIAHRLRHDYPDDPEMRVSHETIYQSMYVQARGGLRAEVAKALRTGRIRRKPAGRDTSGRGRIKDMVMISDRPAEVEDRSVPGHWEGDLIMGAGNRSAIGTLVERTTGFLMLVHLPGDHTAATVAAAMTRTIPTIPEILRRSLTWDQGVEMAHHTAITNATGLPIYFCDPHSPWQRATNENTNGLLRQYFPKGADLSFFGPGMLDQVAAELNDRPRKRLNWMTPAEKLEELLQSKPTDSVAPTT
ncbi:IS30 family transposase [Gordonia crocea]|uniref:IS30 family transposase n=2 Tax=Gordonia crocea TaxID=589162 RepID=A0A7I9UXY8_9ACTN|nr:IS30 family transposase [Gordonia crocea]GED97823.1 IS30 family transposase [Gordonia crocea]